MRLIVEMPYGYVDTAAADAPGHYTLDADNHLRYRPAMSLPKNCGWTVHCVRPPQGATATEMEQRPKCTRLCVLVTTDFLENGGTQRQKALTVAKLPDRREVHCFAVGVGFVEGYLREPGDSLEIVQRRCLSCDE